MEFRRVLFRSRCWSRRLRDRRFRRGFDIGWGGGGCIRGGIRTRVRRIGGRRVGDGRLACFGWCLRIVSARRLFSDRRGGRRRGTLRGEVGGGLRLRHGRFRVAACSVRLGGRRRNGIGRLEHRGDRRAGGRGGRCGRRGFQGKDDGRGAWGERGG